MMVSKLRILEVLRSRGLDARADWVDKELPDEVDTVRNAGLLTTLHLDVADLVEDVESNAAGS
jgi:hypothetical protein